MVNSPIVLFVYNRPEHTRRTLQALMDNKEAAFSKLFIYADGPKVHSNKQEVGKIEATRKVLMEKQWCGEIEIIKADSNLGLANSVIKGTTNVLKIYDRLIILEDDVIVGRHFIEYMNNALEKYQYIENVYMVAGYIFPVKKIRASNKAFFLPLTSTQAWGTWRRAWLQFDESAIGYHELKTNDILRNAFNLDGSFDYTNMLITQMESDKISSWAIRWWWTVFKKKGLVLYPDKSLVKNIGWDNSGTHSGGENPYFEEKWKPDYKIKIYPTSINIDNKKFSKLKEYFLLKTTPRKISNFKKIILRISSFRI